MNFFRPKTCTQSCARHSGEALRSHKDRLLGLGRRFHHSEQQGVKPGCSLNLLRFVQLSWGKRSCQNWHDWPLNAEGGQHVEVTVCISCSRPDPRVFTTTRTFYSKQDVPPMKLRQCVGRLLLSVNLAVASIWRKSDAVVHLSLERTSRHGGVTAQLSSTAVSHVWALGRRQLPRSVNGRCHVLWWQQPSVLSGRFSECATLTAFCPCCDMLPNVTLTENMSDLNTKPNFIIFFNH